MKKTKSLTKKLVCVLLIILTIIPNIFQTISLAATLEVQSALVKYDRDCELNLQYWNGSRWSYVTCSYVYYEQNGNKYPCYCLNKGVPGVRQL